MASVKIFWDPEGQEVDQLGNKDLLRVHDGDTPYVSMSIRMLSIDTPEVGYQGEKNLSKLDAKLAELAKWISERKAPISKDLGDYLAPKLATGRAGTLQGEQGAQALQFFQNLLDTKLTKPNGTKRKVFLYAADEHFEKFGRLLAYLSPYYTDKEKATMSRKDRATFNLLMVDSGWAASFPIYPSIPRMTDLMMLQEAAKAALETKKGIWTDPATLAGYEFRMCVRLHGITKKIVEGKKLQDREKYSWIERYCVDMTTREVFFPQDYHKVQPYNRIFIYPKDIVQAVAKMNLLPAGSAT
jgi:endonuclease YncB( thermonuclease family)